MMIRFLEMFINAIPFRATASRTRCCAYSVQCAIYVVEMHIVVRVVIVVSLVDCSIFVHLNIHSKVQYLHMYG